MRSTARPSGRLSDGTPYFAPIGELRLARHNRAVQCHLCGGWFQALAPAHLQKAHGWNHLEYREAFGLMKSTPLRVPRLVRRQRAVMKHLLRTNVVVVKALLDAQDKMRSGELEAVAHPKKRGPQPAEQRRRSARAAQVASQSWRRSSDAARLERVRMLGFRSVSAYLRQRYVVQHRPLAAISAELRTGQATLHRLLAEAGIAPRHRVVATGETRRAEKLALLTNSSAPDGGSWADYLRRGVESPGGLSGMAREAGRSRAWVVQAAGLLGIARPTRPRSIRRAAL